MILLEDIYGTQVYFRYRRHFYVFLHFDVSLSNVQPGNQYDAW